MTVLGKFAVTFALVLFGAYVFGLSSMKDHSETAAQRRRKELYGRIAVVLFWVGTAAEVSFILLKIWGVS